MKFFRLSLDEAGLAKEALLAREQSEGLEPSIVAHHSVGFDTVLSVQNLLGEQRLREALESIGATYVEATEKPVLGQDPSAGPRFVDGTPIRKSSDSPMTTNWR